MKNIDVIVPNSHEADLPVQNVQLTSHISSLVAITATGAMFQWGYIITRESERLNRSKCPYFDKINADSTSSSSVTLNIFEVYFLEVVFGDITRIRTKF